VSDTLSRLSDLVRDGAGFAVDLVTRFAERVSQNVWRVANAMREIASRVGSVVSGMVEDATQWGRDLIQALIDGIRDKADDLARAVDDTMSKVRDRLPSSPAKTGPLSDIDQSGSALIDTMTQGIGSSSNELTETLEAALETGGGNGGSLPGEAREIVSKTFLDGREVGRGTSGERYDETARRGQTF